MIDVTSVSATPEPHQEPNLSPASVPDLAGHVVMSEYIPESASSPPSLVVVQPAGEIGGQAGLEPTRYGDWESGGRCTDF